MKLTPFGRAMSIALLVMACAAVGSGAAAQACAPGAKVEYKAQNWPEKWEIGTCLRELPGGTQVLIREKPSQFFPEGFERAYALADVRAAGAAPAAQPDPAAQPAPARQAAAPAQERGEPAAGPAAAPRAGGGGLMSQQDVLSFLRERLGDGDPFMNPKREQVLQALREEVLRRGVDFHSHAIGDFANQLSHYGALSNVTYALSENFGPPARQAELTGKWRLMKVGAPTTVTRGGQNYRQGEYAGLAGSLTIGADGSYVWDSPSGMLRGRWRAATPDEMAKSDKGGEGVVLLAAKSGADWLVFRRREEGPEGDGIKITDLATRNLRERGVR